MVYAASRVLGIIAETDEVQNMPKIDLRGLVSI